MHYKSSILILCFALTIAAVPKMDRVVDSHLSDKDPGTKDYDHEAFVGKEEAEEFEALTPEESKRRLGIIFDKIDTDNDGFVSQQELQDWITKTQQRYIEDNTKREFHNHDENRDGILSWDEYYAINFGFLKDEDWNQEDDQYSYKKMLHRDQARWKAADLNGDNSCTLEEYKAFLHPEEYDRMKEIVLSETMGDMDKDGDGMLDMNEYMNDIYKPEHEGETEPDWVEVEREQFQKYRDADKDGKLDREEVRKWILPEDYNHALAESQHLIHESDDNKDEKISKEEMVGHHDVFVGSQATEWGDMMNRHDEF